MDRDRAREVLRQAEQVVKSEPVYGGRPAEVVREGAVLELLDEKEIAEMLSETREERDAYVEALRRIAAPDGWPAGTVVQIEGSAPGPLNRWIVAQGPIPAEQGDETGIFIDEACMLGLVESRSITTDEDISPENCWVYYDARSFELA